MDRDELLARLNRLINESEACERAITDFVRDREVVYTGICAAQNMAGFISTVARRCDAGDPELSRFQASLLGLLN